MTNIAVRRVSQKLNITNSTILINSILNTADKILGSIKNIIKTHNILKTSPFVGVGFPKKGKSTYTYTLISDWLGYLTEYTF